MMATLSTPPTTTTTFADGRHHKRRSPCRTIITSFTPRKKAAAAETNTTNDTTTAYYEEGDWVLDLQASSSSSLACSLSNGQVLVYDQERLHTLCSLSVPTPGSVATELAYGDNNNNSAASANILWAACSDGAVCAWDIRCPHHYSSSSSATAAAPQLQLQLPQVGPNMMATTLSVGFGGDIVAVGTDKGQIHFCDVRNSTSGVAVVGSYTNAHTGCVNRVRFVNNNNNNSCGTTLLTAGEDGLINIFDTRQATEETALDTVLNVGAPVRRMGLCGGGRRPPPPQQEQQHGNSHNQQCIYALTGNEGVAILSCQTATCVADFGGGTLRQDLANTILTSNTNNNNNNTAPSIDYLVDARWDDSTQQLMLLAGNRNGDAGLFRLNDRSSTWEACCTLTGGHKGVVRSWATTTTTTANATNNNNNARFLTAGEDARLCEWDCGSEERHIMAATAATTTTTTATVAITNNRRNATTTTAPLVTTGTNNNNHNKRGLMQRPGGGPLKRRQQHRSKISSSPY